MGGFFFFFSFSRVVVFDGTFFFYFSSFRARMIPFFEPFLQPKKKFRISYIHICSERFTRPKKIQVNGGGRGDRGVS